MSVAQITLSNKGQIVIPKEIRDELHCEPEDIGYRPRLIVTRHDGLDHNSEHWGSRPA
jgi:bifunctional DNA-binding transcriptional regulator/antitoxin component of YhaV-PrlF toxin-antitoxin module